MVRRFIKYLFFTESEMNAWSKFYNAHYLGQLVCRVSLVHLEGFLSIFHHFVNTILPTGVIALPIITLLHSPTNADNALTVLLVHNHPEPQGD